MIDVHLDMPHAVVLQRLTGTGPVKLGDIALTLRNQGIEPKFLADPRVIRAALDDLEVEGYVGCLDKSLPSYNDRRYIRLADPSPEGRNAHIGRETT